MGRTSVSENDPDSPTSRTFEDARLCMRFNHAFFERDADRVAFLLAGWLQVHGLILSGPARQALLSVLSCGARPFEQ